LRFPSRELGQKPVPQAFDDDLAVEVTGSGAQQRRRYGLHRGQLPRRLTEPSPDLLDGARVTAPAPYRGGEGDERGDVLRMFEPLYLDAPERPPLGIGQVESRQPLSDKARDVSADGAGQHDEVGWSAEQVSLDELHAAHGTSSIRAY
jgi:hypothetical protein